LHLGCEASPAPIASFAEERTSVSHPGRGETTAHPGRPITAVLVQCVCETVQSLKARRPHVAPSAAQALTALGHQWIDFFSSSMSTTMSTMEE